MNKNILDPCCGSRMMWFDRQNQKVIFGDKRKETISVSDKYKTDGKRVIEINPDALVDFRNLPYEENAFKLVAFDPPHLVRAGAKSWLAAKYGTLGNDWREDLTKGFSECFRVLEPNGVLIFKWNETDIKLSQILELTPEKPLFGHRSGKHSGTHWLAFMKN